VAMDVSNETQFSGTVKLLMAGIIVSAGVTSLGVILLSIFAGDKSTEATAALMVIMVPVITGLMTILVARMSALDKQIATIGQARAEGALKEKTAGAELAATVAAADQVRAAEVAVATAELVADKAAGDIADAEARIPKGS